MWTESSEPTAGKTIPPLRTGLTTGSCATACSVAAALSLLVNNRPNIVSIILPKGKIVELTINDYQLLSDDQARASTIKDAGDDPDVTHGATVFVELQLCEQRGVAFTAGEGVGTVTKEGLLLDVGEPAINPVPREMIQQNLQIIAEQYGYQGGFIVAVGVENGENIAQKTMNPRLGIIGGLSILGTTGIVRPFSCAAWIASIYQGVDVAQANGIQHIAASTGNSSEQAIREYYQLEDTALIEMGDFAGAVLKHLRKCVKESRAPLCIKTLSICGGFGKISKLAQGHMDLNSRASSIDFEFIASVAKDVGANDQLCEKIQASNTSIEALKHCQSDQIDLAAALCDRALAVAKHIVPASVEIEVIAIDRRGQFVGSTNPAIILGKASGKTS